ncbi:MAG TPA: Bax inhibitor-1/YccA family protein [Gammaproteobacteria bacterium]|nr:Bax inhibitor-1/YccA family protein [Gammaproteobacteria bacterium]
MNNYGQVARGRESALATNKVLRNTYMLLSMSLIFSGVMAGVSMAVGISQGMALGSIIGAFVLVWLVLPRFENSTAGIFVVFAFTGLMGLSLGPMLSYYLAIPNGGNTVMTALGGTGVIFLGLSGYVLTTRKDFSFMGGFLFVGLLVILGAAILNIFFSIPAFSLAISSGIILLMSGFILFDTSRIIHGGETNYIRATVSLYLNIHNLFVNLLYILGAFSGDD